ncbi:MAG: polymorphic toxin type 23 domain-containing protein [Dysgonomonas sp.]
MNRLVFILLLISTFSILPISSYGQYKFRYDNDYLTTLSYGVERQNGFRISVSLVAMFTAGAADRNGFRLGTGFEISQTLDNWTISTGLDFYKAQQKFGIGTSFAGVTFNSRNYGASYYINKYYQGDKQVSGLVTVLLDDFKINFEDDILALPFTGFKIYDRYRTAALEVRYKGFMIGTNVYTTDINGVTDYTESNPKGVYRSGKQISSPVYVGYSTHNLLVRYGVNSRLGGVLGQNGWHQHLFDTPDFEQGNYKNHFLQIGVDKPYTMY